MVTRERPRNTNTKVNEAKKILSLGIFYFLFLALHSFHGLIFLFSNQTNTTAPSFQTHVQSIDNILCSFPTLMHINLITKIKVMHIFIQGHYVNGKRHEPSLPNTDI